MDFTVSDEQVGLAQSMRDVLATECPPDLVRGIVEGTATADKLWRQAVELGWTVLAVPEALGGLGLSYVELTMAFTELGRVGAPGPFLSTLGHVIPALTEVADPARATPWLDRVIAGELSMTLADSEDGQFHPSMPATTAVADGGMVSLRGTKTHVLDPTADEFIVSVTLDGMPALVAVPADNVEVTPLPSLDVTRPLGTVVLNGVRVEADRLLTPPGAPADLGRIRAIGVTCLSAEITGTCQTLLDLTVEYAKVREQFGVAIGTFQAVKHQLADVYVAVSKATAVTEHASMTLDVNDQRQHLAASMAKVAAGQAQVAAVRAAIQLHGGIAYTWEHDVQLFAKRAKASGAILGNATAHRARVARLMPSAATAT